MALSLISGEAFLERYVIARSVGSGGAGIVYEGYDERDRRRVAIKLLHLVDDDSTSRFLREARTLSQLEHPALVKAYEYGTHEDRYYLVMEFVEGVTLQEALRVSGAIEADRAIRILTSLLHGLAAAHAAGVVHRDIKPGNIILTDGSKGHPVKIVDFGLARTVGSSPDDEDGDTQLTRAGTVVGSLRYMAPEQVRGQPLTPASDVYAAGLVAFEMLTGNHPLKAIPTDFAVAMALGVGVDFDIPVELGVSRRVRAVLQKMLQPVVAHRYPTASAVLADLEGAAEEPVATTPGAARAVIGLGGRGADEADAPTVIIEALTESTASWARQKPARQSYISVIPVSDAAPFRGSPPPDAQATSQPEAPASAADLSSLQNPNGAPSSPPQAGNLVRAILGVIIVVGLAVAVWVASGFL